MKTYIFWISRQRHKSWESRSRWPLQEEITDTFLSCYSFLPIFLHVTLRSSWNFICYFYRCQIPPFKRYWFMVTLFVIFRFNKKIQKCNQFNTLKIYFYKFLFNLFCLFIRFKFCNSILTYILVTIIDLMLDSVVYFQW